MKAAADTAEAYRHCERVTRSRAANFYYGIRLLPPEKRRAMCAVYAFARRVDDIGDGPLEREEKLRLLDAEQRGLAESRDARPDACPPRADPVMVALADAEERFSLPPDALVELIEGVRMDVDGQVYESFEELVLYCRRVAGAIGRVCLAIFAAHGPANSAGPPAGRLEAEQLADDLGVAMQLTNILRDLREDAENGRAYLPAEDLRRFGLIAGGQERLAPTVLASLARVAGDPSPSANGRPNEEVGWLVALVRFEADRAQQWFHRGLALAPLLDRRSAACVLAMAGIYRRLLDQIASHPEQALGERMSLPMREKAWVAARVMLVGGR
ncbi:MAG TPA: squalene/phytoene synthase family protein [Solirubrobacteraceae bacterium]